MAATVPIRARTFRGPMLPSPAADARAYGDPGPRVPRWADVDQRGAAADGPAGRPPRPDRVLGLLPGELAAHAALRAGVARPLRRAGAAGHRRAHRRVRVLARAGGDR